MFYVMRDILGMSWEIIGYIDIPCDGMWILVKLVCFYGKLLGCSWKHMSASFCGYNVVPQ